MVDGSVTASSAEQFSKVFAMLLDFVRLLEAMVISFRLEQLKKVLLRDVMEVHPLRSIVSRLEQFMNAFVRLLNLAASSGAGIVTDVKAVQLTNTPLDENPPLTSKSVPSSIRASDISTVLSLVFVAPNPVVPIP